jgi:GNAT superfamily N-acetyltransferase
LSFGFAPAREADFEALLDLSIRTLRADLERLVRFDPARRRARFRESFSAGHTRLILLGGARAGCVTAEPRPGHLELRDFLIEPARQGQGLGGTVLRALLNEDASRPTRLEVLMGSRAARLYLRHGFVRIAEQDFDDLYERPPGLA